MIRNIDVTRALSMKGVNAVVMMDGQADIGKETQNLKVLVIPDINAGGAALDPTAAVAALPPEAEICGCNGVCKGKITGAIAGLGRQGGRPAAARNGKAHVPAAQYGCHAEVAACARVVGSGAERTVGSRIFGHEGVGCRAAGAGVHQQEPGCIPGPESARLHAERLVRLPQREQVGGGMGFHDGYDGAGVQQPAHAGKAHAPGPDDEAAATGKVEEDRVQHRTGP